MLWEIYCFAGRCGVALVLDRRRAERDLSVTCDVTEEQTREGTRYLGHFHFLTHIHWFFIFYLMFVVLLLNGILYLCVYSAVNLGLGIL